MDTEQKAARARAILEDLRPAFDEIRKRHRLAFENSAPDQPEARERAYQMLICLKELEAELARPIADELIEQKKVGKRD